MKTLQSQVLQNKIGIGVNLKELLLHLLLDNGRLDILHQELTSRNGCLNLVNPEGIVIHQVIELSLGCLPFLQTRLLFFRVFFIEEVFQWLGNLNFLIKCGFAVVPKGHGEIPDRDTEGKKA